MINILVIGKDGQVGSELQRALVPSSDINLACIGRNECDLFDLKKLKSILEEFKPKIIVNAAAYTNVDGAENHEDEAFAINAKVPETLAEWSDSTKSLIIHYSTDYVFDGRKSNSYAENDVPNPINVYGKSKLAGESILLDGNISSIVLRTSWVYGKSGCNFVKTILRLGKIKSKIDVVNDQCGAPTSAELIASSTAMIILSYIRSEAETPCGLYHLTSRGSTNWYEYAKFVIKQAIDYGEEFVLSVDNISPVSSAEYMQAADRPKNSRLNVTQIEKTFGIRMPDWKSDVSSCIKWIITNEKF